MAGQDQFLNVIDRDEAEQRFRAVLQVKPLPGENVPLTAALGRILSDRVTADVDVPSFDRSNFDGFAVRAADTFGAAELTPQSLRLLPEQVETGTAPEFHLPEHAAATIATGGMIPRGADAVLMIEHAEVRDGQVVLRRAVPPGHGISFAGTDIARGELVLHAGTLLTSRETGVLAALGRSEVCVRKQPRVAVVSTGNELAAPGTPARPAQVYDSNSQMLCDAVRELGGLPQVYPIVRDDAAVLRTVLRQSLEHADVVLFSGGTSKGHGDLCYRVVAELTDPGIVVHGVALKPGKPLCLAASRGKPVVILPGFPTSAIFTFHEFVAPVIRELAGHADPRPECVTAEMAVRVNSEIGRTEYLLVSLVSSDDRVSAFPMGKGSGSVTTFSRADGFVTIGRHTEILSQGQSVQVRLLSRNLAPADLIVIGSHCTGLDELLSLLWQQGLTSKLLTVGSSGGLAAAERGECDLAGIHLLDTASGQYNRPFLSPSLDLIEGYTRSQGIVCRPGDTRFAGRSPEEIIACATSDPDCRMVNRNQGSGTRVLIDRLLCGAQPPGYAVQPSNHTAVAAAICQKRADWGVAIESVARTAGLTFVPCQSERFDFVVPRSRRNRPPVRAFEALLNTDAARRRLSDLGCCR